MFEQDQNTDTQIPDFLVRPSFLDELEQAVTRSGGTAAENIPIEVSHYSDEPNGEVAVWGYPVFSDVQDPIKFTLAKDKKEGQRKHERTSLAARRDNRQRQIVAGGIMVLEGCYLQQDGSYQCRWTESIAPAEGDGSVLQCYVTLDYFDGKESGGVTKGGSKILKWFNTVGANVSLVNNIEEFTNVLDRYTTQTAELMCSFPLVAVRILGVENPIALEFNRIVSTKDNKRVIETREEMMTRFWGLKAAGPLRQVFDHIAQGNSQYKVEIIRGGYGFFTQNACSHFFDGNGVLKKITDSGGLTEGMREKMMYRYNNIEHYTLMTVGVRKSNRNYFFYHYAKPIKGGQALLQLRNIPTANYTPAETYEVKPKRIFDEYEEKKNVAPANA